MAMPASTTIPIRVTRCTSINSNAIAVVVVESTNDINDNNFITFSPLSSLALRNMATHKRFAASFHPVKTRGGNRATEGAARSGRTKQQPEKNSPIEQIHV